MKKFGFTLAEVLITLTIIGVIAAITLPSLMADTTGAQIGPKLAKAVAMFEQANEALLNSNSVDSLSDAGLTDLDVYEAQLPRHLKSSAAGNHTVYTKDGMAYILSISARNPANLAQPAHMQRIGKVAIDINGNSMPNEAGVDRFLFSWWNDGSLRPQGAQNWGGGTWQDNCPVGQVPANYNFCAGHIFENNFKVLYR